MADTVFCYSCRKHHPLAEVTLVHSKGVKRWRCRRSIAESQKSRDQRDAFGKAMTEFNRAMNMGKSTHSLPRPVLELFGGSRTTAQVGAENLL